MRSSATRPIGTEPDDRFVALAIVRCCAGARPKQSCAAARTGARYLGESDRAPRPDVRGIGVIASSPIWRSGCQGVGVDGHGLVVVRWLMWLRLAGRSERSRDRDGWSCSYSGAVPRPLFVARPLSKVERGRRGGRVLRRLIAELVCASRAARAASRAATGVVGEVCLSQSHRSRSESVHIGGAPAVGFGFL